MMKKTLKLPVFLGAVCLVCTAALATVNHLTKERITANENAKKNEGYLKVLQLTDVGSKVLPEAPEALTSGNAFEAGFVTFYQVKNSDDSIYGIAYDGVVTGYAGEIKFQVGFVGNNYSGFRVITSTETAGYGADYLAGLEKNLGVNWQVAITTSQAELETLTMDAEQGGKAGSTVTRVPIVSALVAAASDYQSRIGG
ncbi:MAG: hypothetical protein ACOX3K_00140 [Bacilli bacterium]